MSMSRVISLTTSTPRGRMARRASLATFAALALAALAAPTHTAAAQQLELRPFVGAYIPTGDQRDFVKDAVLAGAQLSVRVIPAVAITGTFGWSPSKDRVTTGNQTLDIYQYDVGAEFRPAPWLDGGIWQLTPFIGAGIGGRTYDYRDLDVDAKTNVDGYGAVGGDLGFGPVGVRLEARDYVSQFKPLTGGGDTKTRNDVGLAVGLTYRF